ncbi:hypothetical protein ACFQ9R_01555 [Nocardia sp. NPDC056541]|uniref:hypothetical protein n=1 Tax=Nocardia sp. NPDC056541 TaxID=3345860 RepID=UPI0036717CF1
MRPLALTVDADGLCIGPVTVAGAVPQVSQYPSTIVPSHSGSPQAPGTGTGIGGGCGFALRGCAVVRPDRPLPTRPACGTGGALATGAVPHSAQ